MKNSDSAHDPNDQHVDEMLAHLKRLEPPFETRVANRQAVMSELAKMSAQRHVCLVPFWRRTLAVPWPVVATAIAMLITLSVLPFLSDAARTVVTDHHVPNDREELDRPLLERPLKDRASAVPETSTLAYYESTTYLCGIGPLRSESRFIFEEHE